MPESTLVLQPESAQVAQPVSLRLPLIIAIVSCASLLLELALTRLFSVILFYHFAFLAISIALLGLGAGGVFAYIFKSRLARWDTATLGSRVAALNAIVLVVVLEIVLHIRVDLDLTGRNFLR